MRFSFGAAGTRLTLFAFEALAPQMVEVRMPELLTIAMQFALATCVAVAVVFYAQVIWSAITDQHDRETTA